VADAGGKIRVAVLTVSDAAARGERRDESGPALERLAAARLPALVSDRAILPDEPAKISRQLRRWTEGEADLILVTGGTGVAPRDRTPEAVRRVLDLEIPGLAEKMRTDTGKELPAAYLSRQVAGVRDKTLIIALPGSPKGAAECFEAIAGLIPHALELIRGGRAPHPKRR
jgi:molybdenum cofactor synthesis domain-containing protein